MALLLSILIREDLHVRRLHVWVLVCSFEVLIFQHFRATLVMSLHTRGYTPITTSSRNSVRARERRLISPLIQPPIALRRHKEFKEAHSREVKEVGERFVDSVVRRDLSDILLVVLVLDDEIQLHLGHVVEEARVVVLHGLVDQQRSHLGQWTTGWGWGSGSRGITGC